MRDYLFIPEGLLNTNVLQNKTPINSTKINILF
jgi:hypothetical protein